MKSFFIISVTLFLIFFTYSCKEDKPTPPVVTTMAVSEVTAITAKSGGSITADGGSPIISCGVCWSKAGEPTIEDQKTTDANAAGSFSSNIVNLEGGTVYYVRAYATNSAGTGYGTVMTFITLGQAPTALNTAATNVLTTSATLNGSANANYLSTVVSFEYGTTINYSNTIDAKQSPLSGNTNTTVSADLTGLTPGTTFHFRIRAVNSLGTILGSDMTFKTLGQVPTAITGEATNLSTTSANLNGIFNPNHLSTIVTFEYGKTILYGDSIIVIADPLSDSTNTNVSSIISGLAEGTIYHYRLKAVNMLGSKYGNDLIFKTLGQVPTATTMEATEITMNSSTLNGRVNPNQLSTSVEFEYGKTTDYGSSVTATQSPVAGSANTVVSASITDLTQGTIYHFRVIAVNSLGTTIGSDITFTTVLSITDIDGNTYNKVTIGTQVWMKENLKTTKYNDGTAIPNITDSTAWGALTTGAYCDYKNTPANSTTYGRLYNWYAVDNNAATKVASNGGKNVCPTGWHVPSDAEWTTLTTYLGESVAGGKLKEKGISHWATPNTGATNETGFTALPGGTRNDNGTYYNIEGSGNWWSSTEDFSTLPLAYYRHMYYDYSRVYRLNNDKQDGFSVRCIKDN